MKYELKECLENIIENYPITGMGMYTKRCGNLYFVIINGRNIYVDDRITLEDAKYILDHFDEIKYVYDDSRDEDTIIGDVDFLLKEFNITSLQYVCFVKHFNGDFTKDDFYKFMRA